MPDHDARIAGLVERALRRHGFIILERKWSDSGDCILRFRAMMSEPCGLRLAHELLSSAQANEESFGKWIDDLIGKGRKRWEPLLEALEN